jgi:copper homeostasis protein
MPGGGIKPYSFVSTIEKTGCREIHVAAWKTQRDDSTGGKPWVTFGGALYPPENQYDVTDRDAVARLAAVIRPPV